MQEIVSLTPQAVDKVYELMLEENNLNLKLRIFVQGGGCAGFQYGFTFDEDIQDDDFVLVGNSQGQQVSFLIDSMSAQYLQGASIDYKEDLSGSQFVINNPNAVTTCGCNSSFSV